MHAVRATTVMGVIAAIAVAACSPTSQVPSPSPQSGPSSPIASVVGPSSAPSSTASSPGRSTLPASPAATSAPSVISQILAHGSARELSSNPVRMAPAADGTLLVEVPWKASNSTVVTRFDARGRSMPGWPITLNGVAFCDAPMPVDDGSVRLLCTVESRSNRSSSGRAYAFDARGRPLGGWPVAIGEPVFAGRVIGHSLRVLASVGTDAIDFEGSPGDPNSPKWFLLSIDPDGTTRKGAVVSKLSLCCDAATIGPDGAAYSVVPDLDRSTSQITSFDMTGVGTQFPTEVDGVSSAVAFGRDRNPLVLSAKPADKSSRIIALFDIQSAPLSFAAAAPQSGDMGCTPPPIPESPVIGPDGTIVLYSEVDRTVVALDPDFLALTASPFTLPTGLVHPRPGPETEHEAGYCPGPLAPTVGPDGSVVLSLEARDAKVGGNLVAVGRDGRIRSGWPVELKRPGAEFWSTAVGSDGTAYALAYEADADGSSTATLLAIAPDSEILYRTTIIEP